MSKFQTYLEATHTPDPPSQLKDTINTISDDIKKLISKYFPDNSVFVNVTSIQPAVSMSVKFAVD